ncbi:MAG: leucyl/phenylalanyl-tRNA--protein transferase [Actinomycetota bacterium]
MTRQRTVVTPPATRFAMPLPVQAEPGNDLVAIGADLAPGTLLSAYRNGLFPMPVDPGRRRSKLAWYSPDPRGILPLDGLKVSRSLERSVRRFEVRLDDDVEQIMRACAEPERAGRWITEEFIAAYRHLHELGWAHAVGVYRGDELVGGLYGLRIHGFFAGESMFHRATDASKVALVALVDWLRETDASLLDVQWTTPHLESLGAIEIGRSEYLRLLVDATEPTS